MRQLSMHAGALVLCAALHCAVCILGPPATVEQEPPLPRQATGQPSCRYTPRRLLLTSAPLGSAARRARALAREEGEKALAALDCLPDSPSKQSLHQMVDYVLERLY